MDYGMPRADNVPSFTCEIAEVLSPTNPLGIKAGGEGGTTGAPAAVVSAIVDALRVYGIRNITMPATPYNGLEGDPGREGGSLVSHSDRHRFRCALISSNLASARSNFSLNSHIASRISR